MRTAPARRCPTPSCLLAVTLLACGGSGSTEPAAPAAASPAPRSRLTLGEGKVTIAFRERTLELVLHADGSFTANVAGEDLASRAGQMSATGELAVDGVVLARLAADGTITVREESKMGVRWVAIGVVDDDGVFTAAEDGSKVQVGADGRLIGLESEFVVKATVASPALHRTVVFLVVASFARGETDAKNSVSGEQEPAPPPTPTAPTTPTTPP